MIVPRIGEETSALAEGVRRFDFVSPVDGVGDYGYVWAGAPASRRWWVFVHGHGSTANQLWTRPDLRAGWWPLAALHGLNVLAVNVRGNSWMGPAMAADVHGLIGWLRGELGAEQVVIGSGSMGGTSSLLYGVVYPEDVDGVIGLCPATDLVRYRQWCVEQADRRNVCSEIAAAIELGYGGSPVTRAEAYALHSAEGNAGRLRGRVFVGHGSLDDTIPVSEARAFAARMAEVRGGRDFRYVEQPGGDHEAPLGLMGDAMAWVVDSWS